MAELRKSYSNYTLRRKRQLTTKGSIYERDWMTVSELDGFAPGTLPVYASGNFKMTINNERLGKKKYSFSNWLLNDSGTTEWTLNLIKEEELKITSALIKPNYSSILDFAYYGSAVELIHGSINDIYDKFPGELYGTNIEATYFDYSTDTQVHTGLYYIENPFNIDVYSQNINKDKIVNPLRYMYLSWDKYELISGSTAYDVLGWNPGTSHSKYCQENGYVVYEDVQITVKKCHGGFTPTPPQNKTGRLISSTSVEIPMGNDSRNYYPKLQRLDYNTHEYNFTLPGNALTPIPEATLGDCEVVSITGMYINGKIALLTDTPGWHIRPKKKYIDESFEKLDDFESVLLNRDTIPAYKATFYTPRETNRGVVTSLKSYVWPLLTGGWNLDMETVGYESYVNGLLYIASYYDDIRTDNIWRSYTHETIKNFDWTTPRDTYVPEMDGHIIDTERMEAMLRVAGRQFDDLKRWIENIKFTVNVSYDSKNNMPDDAMGKFLEMSGWEVKNTAPVNNNDLIHDELYPGIHVRCNPEDANKEFLKRMILNSRNILSKKGTRAGIEAVYSMFGIFDMRYQETMQYCGSTETVGFTIDEYDAFTKNYISGDTVDTIYDLNKEKNGFTTRFERTWSDYVGLMTEEKFMINGIRYLVPWYEIDYEYDGYPYYQMFGGWGKRERKDVLVQFAPNIAEIFSDDSFTIYDETVKNIKVVEDFKTLNETPIGYLEEGDIYYVLNMQGAPDCEDGDYSHYVFFYPVTAAGDIELNVVAYNDEYVWCLVENSEFEVDTTALTWYAKEIIYMESIHDSSIGNNPHDGKQKYDCGKEYFKYYEKLFKGAFDEDLFMEYRARIANENARRNYDNRFRTDMLPQLVDKTPLVENVGFDIKFDLSPTGTTDNQKIWMFLSEENGIYASTSENYPYYTGSTLFSAPWKGIDSGTSLNSYTKEGETNFPLSYEDKTERQNAPICTGRDNTEITISGGTLPIESTIKAIHSDGPDETWSYSVINTKNIRITYHLPWEMEDYVTDVVEFYVKQMIPSTTIVQFVWEYTKDGKRPAGRVPYASITLSPNYQRIRSYESTAEIDIASVNVEDIAIAREETVEN